MIEITADINKIESPLPQNIIEKINEFKSLFSEKINKVDKPLMSPTKKKEKERTQINKIRNEKGEIKTEAKEIQKIVRKYYEQLYAKKWDNLDKMDKFPETYNLPKLYQEESENLNSQIIPVKLKQ